MRQNKDRAIVSFKNTITTYLIGKPEQRSLSHGKKLNAAYIFIQSILFIDWFSLRRVLAITVLPSNWSAQDYIVWK